MNHVTNIHQGQTFEPGRLYCERYNVPLGTGKEKEILKALRKSAENIIPTHEIKNVVFASIDTMGSRRCYSWMHGSSDWTNQSGDYDWRYGRYLIENRQVYNQN